MTFSLVATSDYGVFSTLLVHDEMFQTPVRFYVRRQFLMRALFCVLRTSPSQAVSMCNGMFTILMMEIAFVIGMGVLVGVVVGVVAVMARRRGCGGGGGAGDRQRRERRGAGVHDERPDIGQEKKLIIA